MFKRVTSGLLLAGVLCLASCVINTGDGETSTAGSEPPAKLSGEGFRHYNLGIGANHEFVTGVVNQDCDHVVEITDHLAGSSVLKAVELSEDSIAPDTYLTLAFEGDRLYAVMDFSQVSIAEADVLKQSLINLNGPGSPEPPASLAETRHYAAMAEYFDNPNYDAIFWYDAGRELAMCFYKELKQVVGAPASSLMAEDSAPGPDETESSDGAEPAEPTADEASESEDSVSVETQADQETDTAPDPLGVTDETRTSVSVYIFDIAALEANYDTLLKLK